MCGRGSWKQRSRRNKIIMDQYTGNLLYGKKWTVCGDSFTEGVSGNTYTEGRFAGQNIAYPYFIAERNNMEIVKFFK